MHVNSVFVITLPARRGRQKLHSAGLSSHWGFNFDKIEVPFTIKATMWVNVNFFHLQHSAVLVWAKKSYKQRSDCIFFHWDCIISQQTTQSKMESEKINRCNVNVVKSFTAHQKYEKQIPDIDS